MDLSSGSSDSEWDRAEYDSARNHLPLPRDYSFYPILGQPQFIYHAKVPLYQSERNGATPEKRPNCFSKAFTWYTKERGPNFTCGRSSTISEDRSETPDQVVGFASWLDSKYAEFLRDNGVEPDYWNIKMTQTTSAQYTVPQLNDCCMPKRLNRSKRSKCKARHITGNAHKTGGNVRESFEFILQPMEQECFASQGNCYHKSNTTVNSLDSPSTKPVKTQSASGMFEHDPHTHNDEVKPKKSMTFKKCVSRMVSVPQFPVEKTRKVTTADAECECDVVSTKPSSHSASGNNIKHQSANFKEPKKSPSTAEVMCECVDLIPANLDRINCKYGCSVPLIENIKAQIDEECQTEQKFTDARSVNVSLDTNKFMLDKPRLTDIQMICPTEATIRPCSEPEPQHSTLIQDANTITLAHGECQTRVIPLNLDTVREYPLFMKILCVDKLSRTRVM